MDKLEQYLSQAYATERSPGQAAYRELFDVGGAGAWALKQLLEAMEGRKALLLNTDFTTDAGVKEALSWQGELRGLETAISLLVRGGDE